MFTTDELGSNSRRPLIVCAKPASDTKSASSVSIVFIRGSTGSAFKMSFPTSINGRIAPFLPRFCVLISFSVLNSRPVRPHGPMSLLAPLPWRSRKVHFTNITN